MKNINLEFKREDFSRRKFINYALVASISYHDEFTWSFFTNFVIVPGLILLLITKSI